MAIVYYKTEIYTAIVGNDQCDQIGQFIGFRATF